MPTSGDLKSGDSLFCTTTPPPKCQQPHCPLPPAHKLTQPPWLRTLCEVLHEVHAIKICLHHYNDEIIFAGEYVKKCCRNRTMNNNFEEKMAKFQTKAQKVHFIWEIW